MFSLLTFFSLVLGAIFGSFLLVVSLRHNTGKSLQGRSACFSCNTNLRWYELIPLVSYLIQGGRCRTCGSHIATETLWVELSTAITFMMLSLRGLFSLAYDSFALDIPYLIATLFLFVAFSVLVIIFLYDLRHKIIPDSFSLVFALLALGGSFLFGFSHGIFTYVGFHLPDLVHVLGGILVPLPFYLIWKFSHGRLIGLGDPKLMVGMGFLLGTLDGLSAVIASFWIATLFIVATFIVDKLLRIQLFGPSKKGIMKREIPFGPFLIIGTLVAIITHLQLF